MNIKRPSASAPDLVAAVSSELTPAERRIAEEVLAEPTLLAFGTVSDLAERVGTSRPTVVRFANKLGFDGYTQLQRHVRSDLSHRLARPSERIRHEDAKALPAKTALNNAVASVFEAIDGDRLAQLAAPVAAAKKVWLLSGETSRAGALSLYSGLSMIRSDVTLLEDRTLGTDICDAGPGDAAIVMDFFRYRRQVVEAAQVLAGAGADIVAITDSPLSPLVELTVNWCDIEVPAIGPFASSVPAVAISELLVSRVARDLRDEAAARIDRIEALWEETGVFQ